MEKYEINGNNYELTDNYREAFDLEKVKESLTDYYNDFDYVVGDWSYNKLRLKGFFKNDNPNCKKYNNIDDLNEYLQSYCAYGCKWFKMIKINK